MDRKSENNNYFNILKYFIVEFLKLFPTFLRSIVKFFVPKGRKNISGQLALITGGSEGIGRALAFRLAQEGCNIAIANRNLEKGQKTAEEVRKKFNVKVQAFQCDVSRREDVKRLKGEVQKSLGTVDLLINNAGLLPLENSLLEGNDDEFYQYCMDVNMTSWIWTTRAFLPDMIKQRRGHIVGISSLSVNCPIFCSTIYVSTKFANKGFMDGLREDMCLYGFDEFIKITTGFPGFIKTNDEHFKYLTSNFHECAVHFSHPDITADRIVIGILKDCENIYGSWIENIQVRFINLMSRDLKTETLRNSIKSDKRDEFIKMKLRECKLLDN